MTFKKVIRFTNDACKFILSRDFIFLYLTNFPAGLEKILRLLQSISQILSTYASSVKDEFFWLFLRKQFALGKKASVPCVGRES